MRPTFRLLDDAQIDALHAAALEILHDPGIRVTTADAHGLLLEAGVTAEEGDVFRLPAALVDDALASAPNAFRVFGRDAAERLRLGEGNVYFGSGVTALKYLEPVPPSRATSRSTTSPPPRGSTTRSRTSTS
jgi:trimethylamine---corrinoid protein Co-methyltransferase